MIPLLMSAGARRSAFFADVGRRRFWSRFIPARPTPRTWIRVSRQAMACRFEVTLPDRLAPAMSAARAALDEVDRLEAQLTVFRDTSALSQLNAAAARGPVTIDPELLLLLQRCQRVHAGTGGAFDITSTPLSRCWLSATGQGRVPSDEEHAAALAISGMRHVEIDATARTVRFARPGVQVNLGAIGKGYALDVIARGLAAAGVNDALLSAGRSSVRVVGGSWTVDVRSPLRPDALARLRLTRGALGTSGAGERFAFIDGQRYGHIIDPRSGWPASGLLSVSVVAADAASADALSTAFFVGGAELAKRYCADHRDVLALVTSETAAAPQIFGGFSGVRIDRP